jgi:hypothetical protein
MKTKTVVIGLGVAVLVAGVAVVGGRFYLQHRAEQRLDAILASLPAGIEATHGPVTYAPFEDRVDVGDLVLDPHLSVGGPMRIGHMTVVGHVQGGETRASSAHRVVLDDIDYDVSDTVRLSVGRLSLGEVAVDPERLRRQQYTAALSLGTAEATDIRLSGKGPNGESFAIREACRTVSGVKAGRIAATLDTGIAADIAAEPEKKLHLDLVELRTTGIDLNGWALAFFPALYTPGEGESAEHELWGGIEAYGLALAVTDADAPTTMAVAGGAIGRLTMGALPFTPESHPKPTPGELFQFVSAFSLGGFRLGEVAAKAETRPLPVSVALGGVALKFSPGRLDYAVLDDFAIRAPGMSFTIGSYRLDGFAIRFPEHFFDKLEAASADLPGAPKVFFDHYRLADLLVKYPLGEVSLKDMSGGMSGTIDKPTHSTFDMVDLDADLTPLILIPGLRTFGYGHVGFAAHSEAEYDVDIGLYDLTASLGAPEMGKLSFAVRVRNIPFEFAGSVEALGARLLEIAIEGAQLRYDDASLVDHVIAVAAESRKESPETIRRMAIEWIENDIARYPGRPRAIAAAREFVAFLQEPHTIRIQVKPERPVTIAELATHEPDPTPEPVLELLNLTIDRP